LQGKLTPDFAALAPLLPPAVGRQFVVSGNQPGTFLLSSPLPLPADPNLLTVAAQLPVDTLKYRGIELRQFTLPVDINRGRLRLDIAAQMAEGTVTLQPQWQLASRRNAMTLPPSSQVLQGVPLDKPLIDDVLARIHPLLGGVAEPEGTIDLRLDNFSWPLTGKGPQQADFTATVALGNIRLKAAKILRQVLDPGGLDHRSLQFKDEALTCTAKRGRITCPATYLLAGGHEIGIRSEGARPGSLHTFIQMPLTEQLAARVQLPWFSGLTVEAEIVDTKKGPVFNQKIFLAGVAEQLTAAAAAAVQPEQPVEKTEIPSESPAQEKPMATGIAPETGTEMK
jgi:hypothetical protein